MMLLDTHTLIWFLTDSPELPNSLREEIADADNDIAVSIVSLWEIGIKSSIGKLPMTQNVLGLEALCDQQNINILPISVEAIYQSTLLEWHHKDPFDRLIIATTMINGYIVISNDIIFDKYPVQRKW